MNNFVFDHNLVKTAKIIHPITNKPDYSLTILPPPKRFLLAGSKLWTSSDTLWSFYQTKGVECIKLRKHKEKVQLISIFYNFNRKTNIMYEEKRHFQMFSYMIKKKALYHFFRRDSLGTKKRWVKQINRVSLEIPQLPVGPLTSNWIKAIAANSKMETNTTLNQQEQLLKVLVEHRIGKKFPDNLTTNMGSMLNSHESGSKQRYKFLPILVKTGSTNKAINILLGKYADKTLIKLLHGYFVSNSLIRTYHTLPKNLKHFISHTIKRKPRKEVETLLKATTSFTGRWVEATPAMKTSWIKTMRRLDTTIDWHIWKDMCFMFNKIGLRIRPNKFKSIEDIIAQHDRAVILNRAIIPIIDNKLPDTYLKVEIPHLEGYDIKQLLSRKDLENEYEKMRHCIIMYHSMCANGVSILFNITNKVGESWTVEYSGHNYNLVQAEGKNYSRPSIKDIKNLEAFGKKLSKTTMCYETEATQRLKKFNKEKEIEKLLITIGETKEEKELIQRRINTLKKELQK